MKKISFVAFIIGFTILMSCKKKHTCYAFGADSVIVDTVLCNCSQETIDELESSPYIKNDINYSISCINQ